MRFRIGIGTGLLPAVATATIGLVALGGSGRAAAQETPGGTWGTAIPVSLAAGAPAGTQFVSGQSHVGLLRFPWELRRDRDRLHRHVVDGDRYAIPRRAERDRRHLGPARGRGRDHQQHSESRRGHDCGGAWTAQDVPGITGLAGDAPNVSCAEQGDCAAAGFYYPAGSGEPLAFVTMRPPARGATPAP